MQLVSIIIPCYNYGRLLAETLDSVAAQTHTEWECLIIDDGSADNTREVAEGYQQHDKRFRYLHQQNKGMSAARNWGITEARGNYLQFLDADDLLVPRKLELQVAYLVARPAVDLVYGDVRCFQHGHPAVLSRSFNMQDEDWMPKVQGSGQTLLNALVEGNIMAINAALLRRALIDRVGLFSEALRGVEDWEFWVRCAAAGAYFGYDPAAEAWALVRVHPSSTSHNVFSMHHYEATVREQLDGVLKGLNATDAVQRNKLAITKSRGYVAEYSITRGSVWRGIWEFVKLARDTGHYTYYLKSIPYWLKKRAQRA